jgi:CrcB protein
MTQYALIFLGGGIGAVARFVLGHAFRQQGWINSFPWHTFLINILGSLALGILAGTIKDRHDALYLLLGVGLCGGFTTFSAFSLETLEMLNAGRWPAALAYVLGSVLAAMLGCWLGLLVAKSP